MKISLTLFRNNSPIFKSIILQDINFVPANLQKRFCVLRGMKHIGRKIDVEKGDLLTVNNEPFTVDDALIAFSMLED